MFGRSSFFHLCGHTKGRKNKKKTSVKKIDNNLPKSLNLNGNIFFKLLTELDENMALVSYRKTKNKNTAEKQNKQVLNITPHGFQHENGKKAKL